MTVVYCWIDPRNGKPVYVGKTSCGLEKRIKGHKHKALRAARLPSHLWLKDLLEGGFDLRVVCLEETDQEHSSRAEARWHRRLSKRFKLLNLAPPGAGNPMKTKALWGEKTLALVGKIPDKDLAEIVGCSHGQVKYLRQQHGLKAVLPARDFSTNHPIAGWNKIPFPEKCVAFLGQESDASLGKRFGLSKTRVSAERKRRNIASCAAQTGRDGRLKPGAGREFILRTRWNKQK